MWIKLILKFFETPPLWKTFVFIKSNNTIPKRNKNQEKSVRTSNLYPIKLRLSKLTRILFKTKICLKR